MPGIVEFPRLVQDALAQYGDLLANECQRRHFAEYLTGLIVAERKTVLGIHDEFARITDSVGIWSRVVFGGFSGGGLLPDAVVENDPLDDLGQQRRTVQ